MENLLLLAKVSRPALWPVGALVFLGGILYSHAELDALAIAQLALFSFPASLYLCGINDVHDTETDRLNPRKGSTEGARIPAGKRNFVEKASLLMALPILAASFLTLNAWNALSTILFILLGYAYSAPPARLKEKPPLDSLSNGIGCLAIFAAGYGYGADPLLLFPKAIFGVLCIAGLHAVTTMMDYDADRKAGQRTFAIAFGKRAAVLFALLACVAALLFSGVSNQPIMAGLFALSFLFGALLIFPDEKLSRLVSWSAYALFLTASLLVLAQMAGISI